MFLSLEDFEQKGLCLVSANVTSTGISQDDFTRIQGNLFNSWLGYMKSANDVETVLNDIPKELWNPSLARPGKLQKSCYRERLLVSVLERPFFHTETVGSQAPSFCVPYL